MNKTDRGFAIQKFEDSNDVECKIQQSSIATDDRIWLGATNIGLKHFKAGQGWNDVELENTVEEHYIANNAMHLDRETVAKLLPLLKRFVNTGNLQQHLNELDDPKLEKVVDLAKNYGFDEVDIYEAEHYDSDIVTDSWYLGFMDENDNHVFVYKENDEDIIYYDVNFSAGNISGNDSLEYWLKEDTWKQYFGNN